MAKDEKLKEALDLIVKKNENVTPKDFVDKDEIIEDVVETEEPIKESKEEKKVEKPETPEVEKSKKVVKTEIDFKSRGFNTLKEAQNFVKTDYFKGLGKVDQEEYLNWLK